MLAGPTTFAAILHAFQVNHRSMAIAQRSGDVWKILSAVRTEFKRYNDTVSKVAKQLNTAAGSVAELGKRSDMMDRALRSVETMPDDGSASRLLGLQEKIPDGDGETELLAIPFVPESTDPISVSDAIIAEERGSQD
jgi:DNA recombination protein RmuC